MKNFLIGVLMALAVLGGVATDAYACCGGGYYCSQDCDDSSGEYCGRYGCGR